MADNCLEADVNGGKIIPKRRTKKPEPKPKWQVGSASNPKPTDEWFEDEMLAIEKAEKLAQEDFYWPVAVWDENYDIVHLFLCGQQFKPV